jgi:cytochrome c oxidase cbb3-type subunit 1
MSAHSPTLTEAFAPSYILRENPATRAEIDRSTRGPVLVFFTAGLFWLVLGSLLGFTASFKLHNPDFLGDVSWLTFGRVRPAHLNAVIYGWASTVGMGVAIWLMARLCQTPLRLPGLLVVAGVFWNLGVLIGFMGILGGESTSIEWLEFPPYATSLLFISFALMAIWVVIMFRFRRPGHVYVSQWYLLAGFFWFPWLYGTVQLLLIGMPVSGALQPIVNWWFAHNVLGLWFTPIGLAAAYYFIPKVIGKPVYSYYLSAFGFWTLALFYSWNGAHHLIGGPLPIWVQSASIVASIMMVIPVLVVALNHHMTLRGHFHLLLSSPTLRFIVFGAMMYTLVSLEGCAMAIRSVNQFLHFTHNTVGHAHMGMYAFFTMVMFGSMYYIVPRLVGCEWRSAFLIKLHFWSCFYGILLMVIVLKIAGIWQGEALANPAVQFQTSVERTIPFLIGRSLSGVLLTIGHLVFAYHFFLMLMRLGRPAGSGATLFMPPEEARQVMGAEEPSSKEPATA